MIFDQSENEIVSTNQRTRKSFYPGKGILSNMVQNLTLEINSSFLFPVYLQSVETKIRHFRQTNQNQEIKKWYFTSQSESRKINQSECSVQFLTKIVKIDKK